MKAQMKGTIARKTQKKIRSNNLTFEKESIAHYEDKTSGAIIRACWDVREPQFKDRKRVIPSRG
jgi:hypothetical protein